MIPNCPFPNRTLCWPRPPGCIDRYQDPIPLRGRMLYSAKDDDHLIAYAISHWGLDTTSPYGDLLWKQAEKEELIPGRTWQSMRGRFMKHLRTNESWVRFISAKKVRITPERKRYTPGEDQVLIRYAGICLKLDRKFYSPRRPMVWRDAEQAELLDGRTASSMHRRFMQHLRKSDGWKELKRTMN